MNPSSPFSQVESEPPDVGSYKCWIAEHWKSGCSHRASVAGFTMIEIAISLAVIAFALVAIIGILPTGLQVQKDNLADTIINQDGAYLMEAIKSGSQGVDVLTNSVETIELPNGDIVSRTTRLRSGQEIIGLLSHPAEKDKDGNYIPVTAIVRALSGAAAEKGDDVAPSVLNSPDKEFRDLAFRYELEVFITNFRTSPNDPYHLDAVLAALPSKLYEVRLEFRWPILSTGKPGNGRRVFRSLVSGSQLVTNVNGQDLFFFQQ